MVVENLVTDKLESASWDVVQAIQRVCKCADNDEATDLHVILLDFAKEIQGNAIRLTLGEIIKAQKLLVKSL